MVNAPTKLLLLALGEPGLLLTRVLGHSPFLGYRGPRELSERKLVKDVRRPGDIYYNLSLIHI